MSKKNFLLIFSLILCAIIIAGCGDDGAVNLPSSTPVPTSTPSTGLLRVHILPANAQATVSVELSSSSTENLRQNTEGIYEISLTPGTYTIIVTAPGYNTVTRTVQMATGGQDSEITIDLGQDEIPVSISTIDPRVCLNTGTVPVTVTAGSITGTVTVSLLSGETEVKTGTNVVVNGNTITCNIDTAGLSRGDYTLRISHNPPVIETSSTTADYAFYIEDTIQKAVDKANELYTAENTGNQIKAFIPSGTYNLPVNGTIQIKSGVYLKGAGRETTVIDGQDATQIFFLWHIENITIESFTLTGGRAEAGDPHGGAIFVNTTDNLLIKDNIITENNISAASSSGGGIYLLGYIYADITENIITKNTVEGTDSRGGAICGELFGDSTCNINDNNISENSSLTAISSGGGIYMEIYNTSRCNITGNRINKNVASSGSSWGGGIFVKSEGLCNITDNSITENDSAAGRGGGIYINGWASGVINGNNILGNTSALNDGNQIANDTFPEVVINAQNNWWGSTSAPSSNDEVYHVEGIPNVDVTNPAQQEFTI